MCKCKAKKSVVHSCRHLFKIYLLELLRKLCDRLCPCCNVMHTRVLKTNRFKLFVLCRVFSPEYHPNLVWSGNQVAIDRNPRISRDISTLPWATGRWSTLFIASFTICYDFPRQAVCHLGSFIFEKSYFNDRNIKVSVDNLSGQSWGHVMSEPRTSISIRCVH